MRKRLSLNQLLSVFIMPLSLLISLLIMYIIYKVTDVDYYELVYDYKYFYVFSAPVILFFAGGFAITRIRNNNSKKASVKILTISFLLNAVIVIGITAFDDLWYKLYLINPFDLMSIEIFDILHSEYAIFLPIYLIVFLAFSFACLAGLPLLGAYIFSLKNRKIKFTVISLIIAAVVITGGIGIYKYLSESVFYDVKGNEYKNPYDVIYYDSDGNKYKIEEIPDYYFDYDACNVKVKSEDGSKEYYIGECYINEDSGLMIADANCEIIVPLTKSEKEEMEEKSFNSDYYIQRYKDCEGNEYRQIANAIYDRHGKLLKRYRFRTNNSFYQLLKDANADGDYYSYDLKGKRYVRGESIVFYDSEGNTYKRQPHERTEFNTNYDIYDKGGKKTGSIDEFDCRIDAKTGLLVIRDDCEYNTDTGLYEDKEGNNYYMLDETVYDENGKVSRDVYKKYSVY